MALISSRRFLFSTVRCEGFLFSQSWNPLLDTSKEVAHLRHRQFRAMRLNEGVFHLCGFKKMATDFFRISRSCLSSMFSCLRRSISCFRFSLCGPSSFRYFLRQRCRAFSETPRSSATCRTDFPWIVRSTAFLLNSSS